MNVTIDGLKLIEEINKIPTQKFKISETETALNMVHVGEILNIILSQIGLIETIERWR